MSDILLKLARRQEVADKDIEEALQEECVNQHSSCSECLVYRANGHKEVRVNPKKGLDYGCECFKNGKAMLKFLREERKQADPVDRDILRWIQDNNVRIETDGMAHRELVSLVKRLREDQP